VTVQARLADMFGDNGMISTVICRLKDRSLEIDSWIMSCRVLGRRVEEAILQLLVQEAKSRTAIDLIGRYIPTARNGLVKDHFEKLGFSKVNTDGDGATTWRLVVGDYHDKDLPMKVEAVSASAA